MFIENNKLTSYSFGFCLCAVLLHADYMLICDIQQGMALLIWKNIVLGQSNFYKSVENSLFGDFHQQFDLIPIMDQCFSHKYHFTKLSWSNTFIFFLWGAVNKWNHLLRVERGFQKMTQRDGVEVHLLALLILQNFQLFSGFMTQFEKKSDMEFQKYILCTCN